MASCSPLSDCTVAARNAENTRGAPSRNSALSKSLRNIVTSTTSFNRSLQTARVTGGCAPESHRATPGGTRECRTTLRPAQGGDASLLPEEVAPRVADLPPPARLASQGMQQACNRAADTVPVAVTPDYSEVAVYAPYSSVRVHNPYAPYRYVSKAELEWQFAASCHYQLALWDEARAEAEAEEFSDPETPTSALPDTSAVPPCVAGTPHRVQWHPDVMKTPTSRDSKWGSAPSRHGGAWGSEASFGALSPIMGTPTGEKERQPSSLFAVTMEREDALGSTCGATPTQSATNHSSVDTSLSGDDMFSSTLRTARTLTYTQPAKVGPSQQSHGKKRGNAPPSAALVASQPNASVPSPTAVGDRRRGAPCPKSVQGEVAASSTGSQPSSRPVPVHMYANQVGGVGSEESSIRVIKKTTPVSRVYHNGRPIPVLLNGGEGATIHVTTVVTQLRNTVLNS